jgi:hypothetical protein
VGQLKYLRTTLIYQNSIQVEIKSRLMLGNAGCHSVQNFMSSTLLSKNINITIHRTIILYGCETWSLTLREECWLRVFENRVLGRKFGSKRDEVTKEWRELHNEELTDLYSSPNLIQVIKSRRMRLAGYVACTKERRDVYRVLVGKPDEERQLGRPMRRWEDNIKMNIRVVRWWGIYWIDMAQDRDRWWAPVNATVNLRVPLNAGNFLTC